MTAELTIYGRLSGLNEYTKACRANKYVGARLKQDNEDTVAAYIMQQLKGVHLEKPVTLSFIRYEANKKRDLDNIAFAKKFIQDALVKRGVLDGDGWRYIVGFNDTFYVDKDNPRVVVKISEV